MAVQTQTSTPVGYPEGQAGQEQVATRQRRGQFWAMVFLTSTLIGIIVLISLIYNIVDSAFGYVAVQNTVDPASLVLAVEKEQLLTAANLVASESDEELAAGIATSPYAVGFFGYAYLQNHSETLRSLSVDGVSPSAQSLDEGTYPLARPLFLYSVPAVLQEKPHVAAFLEHYLTNVSNEIVDVGYFPASDGDLATGKNALTAALDGAAVESSATGDIVTAGSSTVYPLTQRMADQFKATGFAGEIAVESIGTTAGLVRLCQDPTVDIANASRPINRAEVEACRKAKREPVGFEVGADALAVVVSQENTFVNNLTGEELRLLFTTAETWADVNPAWPAEPIQRYIPGADSGTLDFFIETVYGGELRDLPKATLEEILRANVSAGLMRRFENDQPFAERSQESVYDLVVERVVEATVVDSWSLTDSLLRRTDIEATVATIPNGELEWRSWVSTDFLVSPQDASPDRAGIRPAILGSLWVILFTILVALPIGVGAAIYLEEYAANNWLNRMIETNINNLAGVPSIIYGMLGLAIFVRIMEPLTSGTLLGFADPTTANGRTVFSAGLTLALLVLPLIIINAREAIRAVPSSLRQAGFGLGATKWQVVWSHVLPNALPGILTGNILAMSRAIGETAPLVVVGASTFIALDPNGPFSKFTTLPAQIYQWTSRPQGEFHNIAAAAIVVLLVMLLSLNAVAIFLRNRYSVKI
jgi:phosphate transport system permease protein